jgi:two-component system sensor histidine kinase RegB
MPMISACFAREAERCRAILTRLAQPGGRGSGARRAAAFGALLDDIAAPHRGVDVAILIDVQAGDLDLVSARPKCWVHGLGNLVENAADLATREVRLRARWDEVELTIEVLDDGPGFTAEIAEQIGEPYITSRPRRRTSAREDDAGYGAQEGMGLGFFIAKTLIEQTGGTLRAGNRTGGGAIVTVRWPRGAIDGEVAPGQEFRL